jgi:hypothetical protein
MYCFQDGSEGISIKHEATDTQQEQKKSAVAITFPEIKAEEEVCIVICIFKHLVLTEHYGFLLHFTVHNTYI